MRVLTVRQPWAWAIVHGGKDVENRSRNVAGSYRGPVAIHAASQVSEQGMRDENVRSAWAENGEGDPLEALVIGAVIGVVDVVHAHPDTTGGLCCVSGAGDLGAPRPPDWTMRDHWHLALANPRPLVVPVPARGRLGLWRPDAGLLAEITEAVTA